MGRATAFQEGFRSSLGQGLRLGKQVKENRADKRNRAIDTDIADVLGTDEEVKQQAVELPRQKVGPPAALAGEEGIDTGETDMPMGMRYAVDGDSKIKKVQKLLYDRHGGYSPEYVQAMQAFRGELQSEQQSLMNQAEQALQTGDNGAAAEALTRAYSMFPNGKGIEIKEDDQGNLYGIGFNSDTLEFDGTLPVDAKSIAMARRQMSDPDRFDAYLFQSAADQRARAKEDRAGAEFQHTKDRWAVEDQVEDLQLDRAKLMASIENSEDLGLRREQETKLTKMDEQIEKLRSEQFALDSRALTDLLDLKDNTGFPRGYSPKEYYKHIVDQRKDVYTRIKDRSAGDVGMPPDLYDAVYGDDANLLLIGLDAAYEEAVNNRQLLANPEDVIRQVEDEILGLKGLTRPDQSQPAE